MHPDGTAHGGSAIIIKNNIRHYMKKVFQKKHIQAISVVIEDWDSPIIIIVIYCPLKHNIKDYKY